MTEFRIGNRVRVRSLPQRVLDGGKTGTIVRVERNALGVISICLVRLEDSWSHPGLHTDVPFLADELEPVPGNTP